MTLTLVGFLCFALIFLFEICFPTFGVEKTIEEVKEYVVKMAKARKKQGVTILSHRDRLLISSYANKSWKDLPGNELHQLFMRTLNDAD